ncbi:MAG: acyltransferase [Nitrospina sp.]|nr:acyltransferase [Nitrospina sp.]
MHILGSRHYPLLDFYRYSAAMLVSIAHLLSQQYNLPQAELLASISVELFFVLSGFVLAPQLFYVTKTNSKSTLLTFLARRWIRTVPPYCLAILGTCIILDYGNELNILRFLTYTQNFISDNSEPNFFHVGWSLSIEEWFYVIAPLSLLLIRKCLNEKKAIIITAVIYIVALNLIRFFLNDGQDWGEEIRRSVIYRLDAIFFGIVAYQIKDKIFSIHILIALFFGLLYLAFIFLNPIVLMTNVFHQNFFIFICGLTFSALILIATKVKISNNLVVLFFRFVANISYSIYLFHIMILMFLAESKLDILSLFLFYFIILNLFSSIFYYGFELLILKSRPSYQK